MPDELDDTTAAEVGHALMRWLVNEDPAGVARFVPDLDPGVVDDARAARIGTVLVDLLQRLNVA
ncbi:MAG: hypothetical protein ACHQ06_05770 [Candidatus Dormibacteria bacterium]|jgi:hypothetical protein